MLGLLLTVMSLFLTAATLVIALNYIPSETGSITLATNLTESGITGLQTGYNNYVAATGSTPTSTNWNTVLTPEYVFLPATPLSLTWAYTSGAAYGTATGNYFCLSGTINQAEYQGLQNAGRQFSAQAFFLNTACGATATGSTPTSWPAVTALTYWVYVN